MQPVVFSEAWFARHQRVLLWVLAAPLLGRVARRVLAIRRHDVGWARPVVALYPHAYVVDNGDGTRTLDARTHAKYAKRLHLALWPLWCALHAWDQWVANAWAPVWNLGFDTLTVYPDPDPGSVGVDGTAYRAGVDEAFGVIRGGSGNGAFTPSVSDTAPQIGSSATANQFAIIQHGVFVFGTAALGTNATVLSATFSQWFNSTRTSLGDTTVEIAGGVTASATTLTSTDYQNIGRVTFATGITVSTIVTGGYTDSALNAAGCSAINRTGPTVLETQFGWDLVNSFTGTWAASSQTETNVTFADQTGSANDPRLVVTYSVSSPMLEPNRLRPRVFAPGRAR